MRRLSSCLGIEVARRNGGSVTETRGRTIDFRVLVWLAVAALLAAAAADASAQSRRGRWRSSRYGRTGAELSIEFPRLGAATGRGFSEERDLEAGMGIGFGLMWGFSDNLALEARMVQTNHKGGPDEVEWDMDQVMIGGRFTFLTEDVFQPFVGLGFARVALERDESPLEAGFERVSWLGGYVAAGLDFVWSSQWSGFLRADYSVVGSGHETIGTDEADLGSKERGNAAAVSLGITYRIPSW
jgi:hypothetical protein